MNMHRLRGIRTIVSSALFVTGLVAGGWITSAHAQNIEFAQKLMGVPDYAIQSMHFRSTIINPAHSGKVGNADTRQMRVIPIENSNRIASSERNCSICGVVESISLAMRDGLAQGSNAMDGTMQNIAKQGKDHSNLQLTQQRWIVAANSGLKKHAPLFEVRVRMADGTVRVVNQPTQPEYAVGDYVRVISGAVTTA